MIQTASPVSNNSSNNSSPSKAESPIKRALRAVEDMQAKLQAVKYAKNEPIAIVGMGCRFPGGASSPDAFWDLLHEGRDAVREVPRDRWNADAYYDADPFAPGKVYTREAGFLDSIDGFDAQFFGISAREAASLDPQQRLLLEVGWEALESANQSSEKLFSSTTGVFVGICSNDYNKMIWEYGGATGVDAFCATGNALSVAAGRLSHSLGLKGPSLAVDTACSSSLVALHLACQSLRSGECELALTGGVHLLLSPDSSVAFARTQMLDERCKTFDAEASGYVRGEGCGAVALKRLSDAERDGDNILAVVRGSAVNHNGRSSSLVAPNGPAQQSVIQQAVEAGGVDPAKVDYIEVQGTGTAMGQPIEVGALTAIFCEDRNVNLPLMIGSVKTNLGHLEGASGMASLIKVILALQNEEIPAHLHLSKPNPNIDWQNTPVQVPTTSKPWPTSGQPRLAGINCFGFSGTNAHVLLEEAPSSPKEKPATSSTEARPLHVLTLSAKTEAALQDLSTRYSKVLKESDAATADFCFSANVGRSHFQHRTYVTGDSNSTLAAKLSQFTATAKKSAAPPKVAFFFPHQNSAYTAIGQTLYKTQPMFKAAIEKCDEIARSLISNSPSEDISTGNIQPETPAGRAAIFAVEYALYQMWKSWGVEPTCLVSAGVGDYVAACAAGVFNLETALTLLLSPEKVSASFNQPKYSILSQGKPVGEALLKPEYWQKRYQDSSPFQDLSKLSVENANAVLVLGAMETPNEGDLLWLASLEKEGSVWQTVLESLGQLYERGSSVNWRGFDRRYVRRSHPIPTYPWQRQRHWIDTVDRPAQSALPIAALPTAQLMEKIRAADTFSEAEVQALPKLLDWLNQQVFEPSEQTNGAASNSNGSNGNSFNGNGTKSPATSEPTPSQPLEMQAPVALSVEEIQQWLVNRIASELGVDSAEISPTEPFDTYGLDSILAIGIASAGKQAFGVEVTPLMLVHHPTIAKLSQHLANSFETAGTEVFEI